MDSEIVYGQVAAIYKGTNAPSFEGVLHVVTDNDDPETQQILDYKIHLQGQWRKLRDLYGAMHYGTGAPVNTNLIWAKTDNNDLDSHSVIEYYLYRDDAWRSFNELYTAVYYGVTAPARQGLLHVVTTTNDPQTWQISDYKLYIQNQWRSLKDVFGVVHYGTVAPTNISLIWAQTTGNSFPYTVVEYHRYISGSWRSFTELFTAMITAEDPPQDQSKLWRKVSGDSFISIMAFDESVAEWINVFSIKPFEISDDYLLSDINHMGVLRCNNADDIRILVDNSTSLDFSCVIKSIGLGEVVIQAQNGVFVNGEINGVNFLDGQWSAAILEKHGDNNFNLIGMLK